MRKLTIISAMLVALCSTAYADTPTEQTIELKDGSTLVIQTNGKMRHLDQRGHAVTMREGTVMEGKDGARYMMKNSAIWKQLYEKGTLNPKQ